MTVSPDNRFNRFRQEMPITQKWAYFDHAAVSPLPGPTAQRIRDWADQASSEGDAVWPEWEKEVQETRRTAARLIAAQEGEIALINNTTQGINFVAEGFPWQPGDNVVTLANEFPSNLYPWLNLQASGVEVRQVAAPEGVPDLQRIAEACDSRTRVVSVSWVGYQSGWRIDVAEVARLAHEQGAYFFLDAIQGMGVFPLNVRAADVDFLAADGHKWMLGPEGAGIFYLKRELLDLLRPRSVGWNSVSHRYDFGRIELDLRDTAARYEGGSQNIVGLLALGVSLKLLESAGLGPDHSEIALRVLELTDYAVNGLQDRGAEPFSRRTADSASGIVSFRVPGTDPRQLRSKAIEAGINLSVRGDLLRLSPHAYNTWEEIDRLLEIVASAG